MHYHPNPQSKSSQPESGDSRGYSSLRSSPPDRSTRLVFKSLKLVVHLGMQVSRRSTKYHEQDLRVGWCGFVDRSFRPANSRIRTVPLIEQVGVIPFKVIG